jgi:hypothetical protein
MVLLKLMLLNLMLILVLLVRPLYASIAFPFVGDIVDDVVAIFVDAHATSVPGYAVAGDTLVNNVDQ